MVMSLKAVHILAPNSVNKVHNSERVYILTFRAMHAAQ